MLQVSWPGWEEGPTNAHDKLRKLMDLPATDDLDCNKNDRLGGETFVRERLH